MQTCLLVFFVGVCVVAGLTGYWIMSLLVGLGCLFTLGPAMVESRRDVIEHGGVVQVPSGRMHQIDIPKADIDHAAVKRLTDGVRLGYRAVLCAGDLEVLVPSFGGPGKASGRAAASHFADMLGVPFSNSLQVNSLNPSGSSHAEPDPTPLPAPPAPAEPLRLRISWGLLGLYLVMAAGFIIGGLCLAIGLLVNGVAVWSWTGLLVSGSGVFFGRFALRPTLVSGEGVSVPRQRGWGRTVIPRAAIRSLLVEINDTREVTAYVPSIRTGDDVKPLLTAASLSPVAASRAVARAANVLGVPVE